MLRIGVHTIFFAVMTVLLCLVCQMYQLRMVTSLFVAVWAVMDEVTKPMLKNGRHWECPSKDIIKNRQDQEETHGLENEV